MKSSPSFFSLPLVLESLIARSSPLIMISSSTCISFARQWMVETNMTRAA